MFLTRYVKGTPFARRSVASTEETEIKHKKFAGLRLGWDFNNS